MASLSIIGILMFQKDVNHSKQQSCNEIQDSPDCAWIKWPINLALKQKNWGCQRWRYILTVFFLYTVNVAISYLLMLAIMTYNLGYFLVIVVGLGIGSLIGTIQNLESPTNQFLTSPMQTQNDPCCPATNF
eukprot:TRINITY_DN4523_c0_g1_i1.p8 TRINITY_DN4523_c0_g1~~TRINITY_DN4523_c0_g1_i1.p8  ORF type:complete len:131 (+),score=5.54 TRINITY_DN4523_c0_g1_i1:251-643(+)